MALVAETTRVNALMKFWRLTPTLMRRLPLVLASVVLCYQFEWSALRYLTSEVALRFAEWRGYPAERFGSDLIGWNGELYQFTIGCTFADVFCGAIPLVWISRLGLVRNFGNIAGLAAALLVFNLFRRCVTDLIFSAGIPWSVADQAIAGAAYFAVWICLVKWCEFQEVRTQRSSFEWVART